MKVAKWVEKEEEEEEGGGRFKSLFWRQLFRGVHQVDGREARKYRTAFQVE